MTGMMKHAKGIHATVILTVITKTGVSSNRLQSFQF